MKALTDPTCCVVDHGIFLSLALKLGETYNRVLYHTPHERGFPLLSECVIGDGFSQIERCDDFWPLLDEIDLFVFPDVQHAGLQLYLESIGKPVWGSRLGDSLELSREKFLRTLKEVGLEVPPHKKVIGLTDLKHELLNDEDVFVKVSRYRGDMETFHWRNWEQNEGMLDSLAVRFGPCKEQVPFIICDAIETDLELGADTFCIDGQWPELMIHGYEAKDQAFLSIVQPRNEMPEQLQAVLQAFGPLLAEYRYRNSFSTELRIADDKAYFIDPCCRFPMPPTGSKTELWLNLPELIYAGAQGELVEPVPAAKFAAECAVMVERDKGMWSALELPNSLTESFKPMNACKIDGRLCFPPSESDEIHAGWLVATGDTIEESIDGLKELAEELPDEAKAQTDALVPLLKELQEAEAQGIEVAEQIPEPESVIQ